MFPIDIDHNRVLRDYQNRLDLAELERKSVHLVAYRPGLASRIFSRLLVRLANGLIAVGTRIREFACGEPCEPMAEPARS